MKKLIALIVLFTVTILAYPSENDNLHKFTVKDISGQNFDLAQLSGKKVLVVNTASKCGLTPQYEDLEKLYQKYKDNDFIIIGFPANNFRNQEPGSNNEIAEFCQVNYGVSFPMMSKVSVKGDDIHPLYQWLTSKSDSNVKWNFQKFMIDKNGNYVGFVSPRTKPFDDEIVNWIEND